MTSIKTNCSTQSTDYSTQLPEGNAVSARRYHAYLLRIWREDESMPWRVQIENPNTDQTVGFPSLTELHAFLNRQFKEK